MKHCKKTILILLCISTMISFISCDGGGYYTKLSYSELTNNLLSAEIVTGYTSDGMDNVSIIKVLDIETVKDNLLSKITQKKQLCTHGPTIPKATYGIRLNYPDQTIIFDEYTIIHYDASGKMSNYTEKSFIIATTNNEYRNTITSFLDEELN